MAANGANRADARKALATLLATALVGDGKPAQASYAYKPADFDGQSPVILVTSDGTKRYKDTLSTLTRRVTFYLNIHVFVLFADPTATEIEEGGEPTASAWTESDAEDRIDLLEKSIADVVADNIKTADWDMLSLGPADGGERSLIEPVIVGGKEYQREVIPVEVLIIRG